jgi:hypothetical protein
VPVSGLKGKRFELPHWRVLVVHCEHLDAGDETPALRGLSGPMDMLRAEGAFVNGKPDPGRELRSDDLQALIEQ